MSLMRGLAVVIFIFALIQFGRIIVIFNAPSSLFEDQLFLQYVELLVTGFWALLLTWAAIHLWFTFKFKRVFWVCVGFILYSVARILLYARADYDRQRLPFLIVCSGCILIVLLIFRFLNSGKQGMEK